MILSGGSFMSKNKLCLITVALLAVIFTSCMSAPKNVEVGRYDYSTPQEQDAVLVIGGTTGCWITAFDDETVSWSPYYSSGLFSVTIQAYQIGIPSGTHKLTGGLPSSNGTTALQYQSSTKYNFIAGKTYKIEIRNRNFVITEMLPGESLR